jgi:hypothetical protein
MARLNSSIQLLLIGMIAPVATLAWRTARGVTDTDFASLWQAARFALSGNLDAVYLSTANFNFPYPPHALFLVLPFGLLPYWSSYLAWSALSAAFFAWCARPYMTRSAAYSILTPGALMCLYFGQTGLVVGGLWLLAFRGKWPAIALLTFKPHLGFLSVLGLRSYRQLALVVMTVLALVLLSALIFGLWPDFVEHSLVHTSELTTRRRWSFLGVSPGIAYGLLGWIPFALAAALMLARNVNAFTAATAALIISPYGFSYDMPVACLGIYLAAERHWAEMKPLDRIPLALGFLSPSIASLGVWWIPPILLWCLWVQIKLPPVEAADSSALFGKPSLSSQPPAR